MPDTRANDFASIIGRALVGVLAAFIVRKTMRRNLFGVLVGMAVAVVLHELLDAPVSRGIRALRR